LSEHYGSLGLRESIVVLDKADVALLQLRGQPVVAVDVDLQRETKQDFKAEMHQTGIEINEALIQNALKSPCKNQASPGLGWISSMVRRVSRGKSIGTSRSLRQR